MQEIFLSDFYWSKMCIDLFKQMLMAQISKCIRLTLSPIFSTFAETENYVEE